VPRYRENTLDITITIREVSLEDAPVAFVVGQAPATETLYDGTVRWHSRKLWQRCKLSQFQALQNDPDRWATPEDIYVDSWQGYFEKGRPELLRKMRRLGEQYSLINKNLWAVVPEPVLEIRVCGLSHQHGGTYICEQSFNPGRKGHYFRIDQMDLAVQELNFTARQHGYQGDQPLTSDITYAILKPEVLHAKAAITTLQRQRAKELTRQKLRDYHQRAKQLQLSPLQHRERPLRAIAV
jgi:hypothetical protein